MMFEGKEMRLDLIKELRATSEWIEAAGVDQDGEQ
jgi:hypothetical protein